ncbi:5'/3'-nucleotidase SurE [Geobacter pickeringii]|uniref:5'/3'-nucleotidase SurE n=1 Tax=Geobacter pickeringii TaxID=345632 RepID=UPI0009FBB680|nr:5'/3'-nucleotidase SurE [Geobacter pickeringii]
MLVLVTNDDGVYSPGIVALASAMRHVGDVLVVAPDRERSAVGHALTLHHPLRVSDLGDGVFSIDGTPTDCVNIGIHKLLSKKPDIVVSGVNHGGNLGDDITYSGTVSAAMEATLMGIPAIAVSLVTTGAGKNFSSAAAIAARLTSFVVMKGLPPDTFLNVNVPDMEEDQLCPPIITSQGKREYEGEIIAKVDPRGRNYYWIGGNAPQFRDDEGTDYHAIKRGHVSITPLHLDLTNYASMAILREWRIS